MNTQIIRSAAARDLSPQSPEHWTRIVFAGILVAGGMYVLVTHQGVWSNQDLGVVALCLVLGTGIAFTGSVVALMKAAVALLPWVKKDTNGPSSPPAAEG